MEDNNNGIREIVEHHKRQRGKVDHVSGVAAGVLWGGVLANKVAGAAVALGWPYCKK